MDKRTRQAAGFAVALGIVAIVALLLLPQGPSIQPAYPYYPTFSPTLPGATPTPVFTDFRCGDGTPQYQCSRLQPGKYCSKLLVLENYCGLCGCPAGLECRANICQTPQ